jgi:hypothetical protein
LPSLNVKVRAALFVVLVTLVFLLAACSSGGVLPGAVDGASSDASRGEDGFAPSGPPGAPEADDESEDTAAEATVARTISTDGTHIVTGEINGQLLVTAEEVTLVLDGARINCADGAAILGDDGNGADVEQHLTVELRGENSVSGSTHGIHGKDKLTIMGTGAVTISAAKDGLHAGDTLAVEGGAVNVAESYEGMEAPQIVVSGGDTVIFASDDGVNAASDDTEIVPSVEVKGGTLTVYCNSDGVDSNGIFDVTGGTVAMFVNAPRDGDATDITGSRTLSRPMLYVPSAVKAGAELAVGDWSMTVAADATSFCLILPGVTDGQSCQITADGAVIATVSATTTVQGMMPGGGGPGGARPGGRSAGDTPGGDRPGGAPGAAPDRGAPGGTVPSGGAPAGEDRPAPPAEEARPAPPAGEARPAPPEGPMPGSVRYDPGA